VNKTSLGRCCVHGIGAVGLSRGCGGVVGRGRISLSLCGSAAYRTVICVPDWYETCGFDSTLWAPKPASIDPDLDATHNTGIPGHNPQPDPNHAGTRACGTSGWSRSRASRRECHCCSTWATTSTTCLAPPGPSAARTTATIDPTRAASAACLRRCCSRAPARPQLARQPCGAYAHHHACLSFCLRKK
jgi:hypothetical protein